MVIRRRVQLQLRRAVSNNAVSIIRAFLFLLILFPPLFLFFFFTFISYRLIQRIFAIFFTQRSRVSVKLHNSTRIALAHKKQKHAQTRSNTFKHAQTRSNAFKHAQTFSNAFKHTTKRYGTWKISNNDQYSSTSYTVASFRCNRMRRQTNSDLLLLRTFLATVRNRCCCSVNTAMISERQFA